MVVACARVAGARGERYREALRAHLWATPIRTWPMLTSPGTSRVALDVPVAQLHTTLAALALEPVTLDHVYDY